MSKVALRIGTRGSPLALVQAHEVRARLAAAHGFVSDSIVIEVIKTSGDRIQDRPLAEVGGKGLFTREIEEALLAGTIDLAVHSMKDMPTVLPAGLAVTAVLERAEVRDALLARSGASIRDLPERACVGTSSLRRQAQLLRLRPDLEIVPFRGNVETRLRKLMNGEVDATILAAAGLTRLGLLERANGLIEITDMLPAVAQGAIGIETRSDDVRSRDLVAALDHAPTARCIAAERAFLAVLDGSCRTPIAGLARIEGDMMELRGEVLATDGSSAVDAMRRGSAADAERLGRDVGGEVLAGLQARSMAVGSPPVVGGRA